MSNFVKFLNDVYSAAETAAERELLKRLGGGCSVPVGAFAVVKDGVLKIDAVVLSADGSEAIKGNAQGMAVEARETAAKLASELLSKGAGELLVKNA